MCCGDSTFANHVHLFPPLRMCATRVASAFLTSNLRFLLNLLNSAILPLYYSSNFKEKLAVWAFHNLIHLCLFYPHQFFTFIALNYIFIFICLYTSLFHDAIRAVRVCVLPASTRSSSRCGRPICRCWRSDCGRAALSRTRVCRSGWKTRLAPWSMVSYPPFSSLSFHFFFLLLLFF
jgi:hypothetical protein